jgi:hypothetical protein
MEKDYQTLGLLQAILDEMERQGLILKVRNGYVYRPPSLGIRSFIGHKIDNNGD